MRARARTERRDVPTEYENQPTQSTEGRMELSAVFPLSGFLVGLLVGLTGMGGAALMTPFLILVLGTRPVVAVGTDLAYGSLTKLVGAYLHWRQGTVDLPLVKRLALGSVPAGLVGVAAL